MKVQVFILVLVTCCTISLTVADDVTSALWDLYLQTNGPHWLRQVFYFAPFLLLLWLML